MSVRFAAGLAALTLLVGCSTSRTLTDPRLDAADPGRVPEASALMDDDSPDDGSGRREAGELVGSDAAARYLDELIERETVLIDTMNVGALGTDFPDISDSLAAATAAQLPSVEEIFDYPVVVNRRVLTWIDAFMGRSRGSFQHALGRSGRYLPMARRIFAEEGIPQDLAYLGYVESGFRFNARSHAHALGLWQFMRGTAGDLGLRCDDRVDERLDPEKSTLACARYLKQLHERYDDWLLALAAYNTGPGNVDKAIRRAESRDFWEIAERGHLVHETRNFVPAILAATILAKSPKAYGFSEQTDPPLVYDTILVDHPADLGVLARCAGSSEEELRTLNPALLHAQTPGSHGYEVRVPLGTGPEAEARFAEIPPGELIAFVNHAIRSGDTLGGIAKRYGTSVRAIQDANGMGRSTLIRAGRALRIPSGEKSAALLAEEESGARGAAGAVSTHTVKRGETVSSIARRHGVSVNAIAKVNRMADPARIRVGQKLEIPGTRSLQGAASADAATEAGGATVSARVDRPSAARTESAASLDRSELDSEGIADTATILGRVESTAHLVDEARALLALVGEVDPVGASSVSQPGPDARGPGSSGDPASSKASGAADSATGDSGTDSPPSASRLHVVVPGDTLWQIARKYGVAVSDLARWNGFRSRSRIYPGQKIRVSH